MVSACCSGWVGLGLGSLPCTGAAPLLPAVRWCSACMRGCCCGWQAHTGCTPSAAERVAPHEPRCSWLRVRCQQAPTCPSCLQAQLVDEQRLLIHWCPPEALAGPRRHHGCGPARFEESILRGWWARGSQVEAPLGAGQRRAASAGAPVPGCSCLTAAPSRAPRHGMARRPGAAAHAAQAGSGAYLMLYNFCTAAVERLFVAGSPELADWCAWGWAAGEAWVAARRHVARHARHGACFVSRTVWRPANRPAACCGAPLLPAGTCSNPPPCTPAAAPAAAAPSGSAAWCPWATRGWQGRRSSAPQPWPSRRVRAWVAAGSCGSACVRRRAAPVLHGCSGRQECSWACALASTVCQWSARKVAYSSCTRTGCRHAAAGAAAPPAGGAAGVEPDAAGHALPRWAGSLDGLACQLNMSCPCCTPPLLHATKQCVCPPACLGCLAPVPPAPPPSPPCPCKQHTASPPAAAPPPAAAQTPTCTASTSGPSAALCGRTTRRTAHSSSWRAAAQRRCASGWNPSSWRRGAAGQVRGSGGARAPWVLWAARPRLCYGSVGGAHCRQVLGGCRPTGCGAVLPAALPAGGRAGAARPHHVLYLFHPAQPFLMAVLQDMESGVAERLALWTRL